MNKFILALTTALLFTSVSVLSLAGPVPHPSTYASYEQTYFTEQNVRHYWNSLPVDREYAQGLLALDVYGLAYVKDVDVDTPDSFGAIMINRDIVTPLPNDWEIIFYMDQNMEPTSVFAINHTNGMASVFLPGVLTGD